MDELVLLFFRKQQKRVRRVRKGTDKDGNPIWAEDDQLSFATLLAYVNLKMSLMYSDLAVGVAIPIYTEVMRLNIGTLAMVRALAKALDLIVSFVIGFASDATRTPCGRRLPYIAVGSIFAPLAMWYLAAPPPEWNLSNMLGGGRRLAEAPADVAPHYLPFAEVCAEEAANAELLGLRGNCSELHNCVAAAIADGLLPAWQETARPAPKASGAKAAAKAAAAAASALYATTSLELSLWFLLFFVVRHSIGHTLVMIPYDALGQELTTDANSRQQLFAWKSVFNFAGLLSAYMCQMGTATFMATDISAQARLVAAVGAVMILVSATWLLSIVRERPLVSQDEKKEASVPFLATMYALAKNRPYLNYLAIRLWLTFAFHLPFFSRLNYLKYVMGFENAQLVTTITSFVAQSTSFYSLRVMLRVMARHGKGRTLVYITAASTVIATIFATIPPARFRALGLFCVQPIVEGFTQVALYTIPEQLLADVIDYDELAYGQRREGIFVVFDVNIMQLMDILAGVLPGLVLGAVGYRGNGACSCGCGVKCPASYMRWSCPGDIGYACTSGLDDGNSPLFGQADRQPPCTLQDASVDETIQLFFYAIPAGCFALTTFLSMRMPISGDVHRQIRYELDRRAKGSHELYDPVTGGVIHDDQSSAKDREMMNVVESFSQAEQALIDGDNGIGRLRRRIVCNLLLTLSFMVGLNVAVKVLRLPKVYDTLALFATTLILMLLMWQVLKLLTAIQSVEHLKKFANQKRFARMPNRSGFNDTKAPGGGAGGAGGAAASTGVDEFEHMGERAGEEMKARVLRWLDRVRMRLYGGGGVLPYERMARGRGSLDSRCRGAGQHTAFEREELLQQQQQQQQQQQHGDVEAGGAAGAAQHVPPDREARRERKKSFDEDYLDEINQIDARLSSASNMRMSHHDGQMGRRIRAESLGIV